MRYFASKKRNDNENIIHQVLPEFRLKLRILNIFPYKKHKFKNDVTHTLFYPIKTEDCNFLISS